MRPLIHPAPARAAGPLRGHAADAIAIAVLLAALALVLVTAISSPMKDDVAWLLYVARKWLGGQRLYEDIVEVNPPLIVWIYALPAMVSGWLGVPPKSVSAPFFAAMLLGCAWWTATLLRGQATLFARRLPVFGTIGTVLLLLPGVEFGQREHLLVATALPYIALFARMLHGERENPAAALPAGMLAALGCALKPSYVLAFGVMELVGRRRGGRMIRLASLSAGATLAMYGLGVLVFCPAFLEKAVPLALALYGATDTPLWQILLQSRVLLAGVAVSVLLAASARRTLPAGQTFLADLLLALAAFALAATVSFVLQGKNWFYHELPGATAAVLALLLWGAAMLQTLPRRRLATPAALAPTALAPTALAPAALALAALAGFAWTGAVRLQTWVEAAVEPGLSTEVKLERIVKHEKAKTYIAFSEWIALGFPVVNNTGVTWASRFELHVGAERRTLAGATGRHRPAGMADPPLDHARLRRQLPRPRRGRYPRRHQLRRHTERLRPGFRRGLVPLPPDRRLRRVARAETRRGRMHHTGATPAAAAGHRDGDGAALSNEKARAPPSREGARRAWTPQFKISRQQIEETVVVAIIVIDLRGQA